MSTDNRPVKGAYPKLEDFGVDPMTVSRWRKRLKDDDKFSVALESAQERCRKVCEAEKGTGGKAKDASSVSPARRR